MTQERKSSLIPYLIVGMVLSGDISLHLRCGELQKDLDKNKKKVKSLEERILKNIDRIERNIDRRIYILEDRGD